MKAAQGTLGSAAHALSHPERRRTELVVPRNATRGECKSTLLITLTGRKSGKKYTTPITYLRDGDTFLMTTDSPWRKNLRGGAPVTLHVKGREYAAFGEAVTEESEVARVMEMMVSAYPSYGRFTGLKPNPEGQIDRQALERAARERVVRARLNGAEKKIKEEHYD